MRLYALSEDAVLGVFDLDDGVAARRLAPVVDGTALRFSDTRKFGKVFLVGQAEDVVGRLGPEPLERGFTAARLGRRDVRLQAAPLAVGQIGGVR